MRMLSAVLRPDSGRIWYNHGDIHELNEAYRSRLGYLPQHFGCYPGFTGRRFLHYLGALKGLERDHVKERTEWLLQEVGLAPEADRKVSTYSGGMKQRLGIAQALLNDPRVLILDEPTAGLDPRERVRFRNLISALADRRIILLSTHIVSDVEYIADEILMMREGKLIHTGNPEKIISLCTGISEEEKEKNFHLMEEFQNKAGRLLAFAHKELEGQYNDEEQDEVEQGLIYDGFVVISDPLSPDVYESIRNCRSAGIEVKMLTGDNIRTARAIANELHMLDDDHIAVEAADIEKLTDEELKEALKKIQVIARSTPLVKMRVVKLLKEQGNVVAVTGDGINDAPAIKHADVGIAMGIAGTDVTKEASDMVLLDDSFSTIIKAVQWGRGIYENFKRFIQFQLTVNVSSVVVVICSILAGFSAPFTALELLWINIIMDGPPALTLGLEPIRPDLLKHKPTRRNENIISKKMLLRIFVNGIFISVIFMLQHFKNFLGAASEEEATVLFTLFVLFQLFNAFNCRELDDTPMFKNLLKNKLMLGVFLLVLILQGIITQFGAAVFETVPLSAAMWGKMLLTAFTVIILNEGIKAVKRLFVRK